MPMVGRRECMCVCVREESVGARREREEELENRVYITVFYFSTPLSHPTLLRDLPLSHVFHIYIYICILAGVETPGNDHYLRYSDK